ncbi:MAG: hypothetical protein OEM82_09955 [Acidobacteriota bacterium]|nr:hypothetical protein [Acidobacteriota bacterium]MDH3528897.1 hypothetical protein [Acidobacteriota bacterium]
MKIRNKTNLVLVVFLILLLTIACGLDEESDTEKTNKEEVASTDTGGDTAAEDEDLPDDDSGENTSNSPTTVRFDKGKTSRTYKKSITRGESQIYYLTASSGQTMDIEIESPQENAGFTVYDPAGNEISAAAETTEVRDFSEELADSGKHKIVVSSGRNVDYSITFRVSAKTRNLTTAEADGGANKTVRFAKGATSATYSNSVVRGDRDTYNLSAGAGQFMTVSITSVENNASFQIVAPNGEDLVSDDTNWTEELPRTGNYRIIVGSGRGNATYTIKFKVVQSPIDH